MQRGKTVAKRIGVVVTFGLVAAAAIAAVRASERREALHEASAEVASLRWCLYGDPLAKGESPRQRLLDLELCATAPPADPASTWPRACDVHARAAVSALVRAGRDVRDPRTGPLHVVLRILAEWKHGNGGGPYVNGDPPLVERLEAAVAGADLPDGTPAPNTRPPCKGAPILRALRPLGVTKWFSGTEDAIPGQTLRLVWASASETSRLACLFRLSQHDRVACRPIAEPLSSLARPISSPDELEDIVVRDYDPPRVLSLTRGVLASTRRSSAHVAADGAVAVLDERRVERWVDGAVVATTPLPKGIVARQYGRFVVSGPRAEDGQVDAVAQEIAADGTLGAAAPVGRWPSSPVVHACRDGRASTLLVLGQPSGGDERKGLLLRHDGDAWATPVATSVRLPYAFDDGAFAGPLHRPVRVTCAGDTLAMAGWDDRAIYHVLCRPAGCTSTVVAPQLHGAASRVAVAPVGERVLLAYVEQHPGQIHGLVFALHVRVGEISALDAASDRIVLANTPHGPIDGIYGNLEAFARGKVGVVIVHARDVLHAIRVDDAGTITALEP